VLTLGAAPSLPAAYNRALGAVPIADGSGSCGTAAARGEAVIVRDIEESPLWDAFRAAASANGLRACWSVPFRDAQDTVRGTLALYYREPREPTRHERDLIAFAATLAGMAVQRHVKAERERIEHALLDSGTSNYERVAHDLHEGVCQQLAGLEYLLAAAAARADGPAAPTIAEARALLATVLQDTRSLAAWMLPVARHPEGLAGALMDLARGAELRHGVQARCDIQLEGSPALDAATGDHVFRLAQSTVAEALAHCAPRTLEISLHWQAPCLALVVAVDHGGLAQEFRGAAGQAIRHRARLIGAELRFMLDARGHSAMQACLPLDSPR
jgi:signal transduction histidine kinase